jgi:hypothetical protein
MYSKPLPQTQTGRPNVLNYPSVPTSESVTNGDVADMVRVYTKAPIPHYVVGDSSHLGYQFDRDALESAMRGLFTDPGSTVLAAARLDWSYVYVVKPEQELLFGRAGVIVYQIAEEPPAPAGYWMDIWEPDHSVSGSDYAALPESERAALEAKLQLRYTATQYWARHLAFWHPDTYQSWCEHSGSRGMSLENHPLEAKAIVMAARSRCSGE